MAKDKAVVIFSGGIDSTTLLYNTINLGYDVIAVTFNYGQKHHIELEYARRIAKILDIPHEILVVPHLLGSSLTDKDGKIPKDDYSVETQKSTVVPNRNMVFISIAANYAIALGASMVFYGAHANDRAVYPDCTKPFVDAVNLAVKAGNYEQIRVIAPFLNWTKAQIVERGKKLGVPFHLTWSCYDPFHEFKNIHEGGSYVHCGTCGTCRERKNAFVDADVMDPTVYLVAFTGDLQDEV